MKWPDQLVEDIARRKAVLYIGAGVSASATGDNGKRPPGWVDFLKAANRKLNGRVPSKTVNSLISDGDLLTACELLKSSLDEQWPTILQEQFQAPRFEAGANHQSLHELDLPFVLTSNFDTVYDRYAITESGGTTVVKNYWDTDVPLVLRRNYHSVLKVHGSIEEPSRMVFSRGDYARLRVNNRSFFELVGALFMTHTFFFVGCSLSDPDLRLFLENYHYSHPQSPPHYMTSPTGEIHGHIDSSIRNNMNLKLLRYSRDDSHLELKEGLQALVSDVGVVRRRLAESETW